MTTQKPKGATNKLFYKKKKRRKFKSLENKHKILKALDKKSTLSEEKFKEMWDDNQLEGTTRKDDHINRRQRA